MENLKEMTDETLVVQYAIGNNNAFDEILNRYQNKLFTYILYIVKNESLADDIFQETFVKAIMKIKEGKYVEKGKFSAWITRIAHNIIIDQFRLEKNENFVSNEDIKLDVLDSRTSEAESNVETKLTNDQTIKEVKKLLELLPAKQREIIIMRFYQNMSFKEIAEETGVSINTALGRVRYALLNIRKMAIERNINLSII